MTDEEIMWVLGKISDDCYNRDSCAGCKFCEESGSCKLNGYPKDWEVEGVDDL